MLEELDFETQLKALDTVEKKGTFAPWRAGSDSIVSIHPLKKLDLVFDASGHYYAPTKADLELIVLGRNMVRPMIDRIAALQTAVSNLKISERGFESACKIERGENEVLRNVVRAARGLLDSGSRPCESREEARDLMLKWMPKARDLVKFIDENYLLREKT